MTADAGLPAGSRAVLIGVSAYEYAEFPPIRAARNSLQAMQSLLADPALCGWLPGLITVIANPISAADLADRIADLAETTTGVFLLYYVGHGVLSTRGELCLTVTSTRPNRPKITGLPWETLAEVLRTCPARIRLAILDCCFAGQAIEALGAGDGEGLADIAYIDGVYTLAATTRNRTAHVPPADQQDVACTSFTGELQALIRSGIRGKPAQLSFSDIYPQLRERLRAKGLPAPSQRGTDTAYQFPFTANTAARVDSTAPIIQPQGSGDDSRKTTPKSPEPDRADRPRQPRPEAGRTVPGRARGPQPESALDGRPQQARILTDALRAVWSITDQDLKAWLLAGIAKAVAATDPDRAGRLAADAERIARRLTDDHGKATTLAGVAKAVAATDPDRAGRLADDAEHIARALTEQYQKATILAGVAEAVAATDPGRAGRLADEAERLIEALTDDYQMATALVLIAEAVATTDPDRAGRLAADAERIARRLTDDHQKATTLAGVAKAVAATDPDRAGRLADDAEHIARALTEQYQKATILAGVAEAVAATDPGRAGRLADDAEHIARALTDDYQKAIALELIAEAVAATDPADH